MFGSNILGLGVNLVATYFFIYTIPAAANGGVPGFGALESSLQRARSTPLATLIMTVVFIVTFTYVPVLVVGALTPVLLTNSFLVQGTVVNILVAAIKAIMAATSRSCGKGLRRRLVWEIH